MNTTGIADALRDRLATLLDVPMSSIDDHASFERLGVDSLMVLELVALVEQGVGFDIAEDDIARLRSISDVQEYLGALRQQ